MTETIQNNGNPTDMSLPVGAPQSWIDRYTKQVQDEQIKQMQKPQPEGLRVDTPRKEREKMGLT